MIKVEEYLKKNAYLTMNELWLIAPLLLCNRNSIVRSLESHISCSPKNCFRLEITKPIRRFTVIDRTSNSEFSSSYSVLLSEHGIVKWHVFECCTDSSWRMYFFAGERVKNLKKTLILSFTGWCLR